MDVGPCMLTLVETLLLSSTRSFQMLGSPFPWGDLGSEGLSSMGFAAHRVIAIHLRRVLKDTPYLPVGLITGYLRRVLNAMASSTVS